MRSLSGNKLLLIVLFGVFVLLVVSLRKIFRKLSILASDISSKYENMEKLLLDLRDGTKTFFREKRDSPRIRDSMTAKIAGEGDGREFAEVLNGSKSGALLRTSRKLNIGETLDLQLFLPLYPQPIDVRVRVARVQATKEGKPGDFDVGIEFLSLSQADKEKFIETLNILGKEEK